MKKINKNVNGVTLVSLIITIIVMIILSSIAIYSGKEVINSSKFTKFTTELKIMQTQVNQLYENKSEDNEILNLGKELGEAQAQADVVFTINASGITDQTGYRYFDKITIKNLNIEGIEGEFFINIEKRSVVSYKGFKYEGVTYYTLEQLPGGLYNVGYENKNTGEPTFEISGKKTGENKWKVNIENIKYDGYIDKWKVNYKLEGQSDWNISKDYSFTVKEKGKYIVQIVNGMVKSEEKHLIIGQAPILPAEYQQVEYIESTGTQYIDTGLTPGENYGFYVDFYFDVDVDTTSPSVKVLGSSIKNNGMWGGVILASYATTPGGQMTWFNEPNMYNFLDPKLFSKTRMQSYFINNVYSTSIDSSKTTIQKYTYDYISGSLYLFAIHCGDEGYINSTSNLKMYEYKAYENSSVVQNLIPCYRKLDSEIGMYDIIKKEFHEKKGEGNFLKGADVNYIWDNNDDNKQEHITLPSEYQQVEYIESTGTQYIDTGITPDINTGFYLDIKILDPIDTNGKRLFGTAYRNSGKWGGIFIATYSSTNGGQMHYIESGNLYNPCLEYNNRMQISLRNGQYTTSTGADIKFDTSTLNMNTPGPIYILNVNSDVPATTYSSACLYKAQIYDGDVLVRNFIPCYKKDTGEIGLYDTVDDKFYTNQGTDKFLKGNDVIKLPSEYQQVEYIGGTGEQYFLLDVVSTANFGFDIDMSVSTGTGANVFGGFSRGGQVYCYMGTRNNKITYFPSTNSFDFTLTDYNVRHSYKVINKGSNLSYYYDNIECGTRSFVNNANCSIAVFSFVDNNGVVRTSKTETFSGRIYKFIIYDNETVICNLIPCYKKSNNQVGMYDIINNKFYTNQGTGTFEKGTDVN